MYRPWPCSIALCALLALAVRLAADEPAAQNKAGDKSDRGALFDRLDANGDGQLTGDEMPQDKQDLFRRLLSTSDKDNNGSLSRSEFIAGLESKNVQRTVTEKLPDDNPGGPLARDPEKMFGRLDANGDGKIEADEVPEQMRPMFEKMLARADKNGDGAITKQELLAAVAELKPPSPANLAEMAPAKIFEYLDKDG